MSKIAYLFAGQGSQNTGMGKDFYETYPEFRMEFDAACPENGGNLDFDIHSACFENTDDILRNTRYTQPCMVAFACGVLGILRSQASISPDYVCGLSLGEYSALHAASVWNSKTTIETAALRGKAMAEASAGLDVGMVAIIGLEEKYIEECCDKAREKGIVAITNFNCPGQIVISGEKTAVDFAADMCKKIGAKRCLPLSVSGPFHTELMHSAGEKLKKYFDNLLFGEMKIPVLFNYLGRERQDNDLSVSELLIQQVQRPVRMEQCITRLFNLGVDIFVEIGPGTVLSGFVKKVAKKIEARKYAIYTIENIEGLDAVLNM